MIRIELEYNDDGQPYFLINWHPYRKSDYKVSDLRFKTRIEKDDKGRWQVFRTAIKNNEVTKIPMLTFYRKPVYLTPDMQLFSMTAHQYASIEKLLNKDSLMALHCLWIANTYWVKSMDF